MIIFPIVIPVREANPESMRRHDVCFWIPGRVLRYRFGITQTGERDG
jgi:hypothetical protein